MNIIFCLIIVLSTGILIFTKPDTVLQVISDSSLDCAKFLFTMIGVYAVWLGIMKIVENSGLSAKLAKALNPVIKFLFGEISDETKGYISLNMSSNILGLGNAATPMGIKAINSMNTNNCINKNMIMLMVLNSTGLQILPTTVISLRQTLGSSSPADIILPSLIATAISTVIAVLLCKLFVKDSSPRMGIPQ